MKRGKKVLAANLFSLIQHLKALFKGGVRKESVLFQRLL